MVPTITPSPIATLASTEPVPELDGLVDDDEEKEDEKDDGVEEKDGDVGVLEKGPKEEATEKEKAELIKEKAEDDDEYDEYEDEENSGSVDLEKRAEADADNSQNKAKPESTEYKSSGMAPFDLEHWIQEFVGLQSAVYEQDIYQIFRDLFKNKDTNAKIEDVLRNLVQNSPPSPAQHKPKKDTAIQPVGVEEKEGQDTFLAQATSITNPNIKNNVVTAMLMQPFIDQVRKVIRDLLTMLCGGLPEAAAMKDISDPEIIPQLFACLQGNISKFTSQLGAMLVGQLMRGKDNIVQQLLLKLIGIPTQTKEESKMPVSSPLKVIPEQGNQKDYGLDQPLVEQSAPRKDKNKANKIPAENNKENDPDQITRMEEFAKWLVDNVLEGLGARHGEQGKSADPVASTEDDEIVE
ncbi:hypothetical protein BGX28_004190 [Mortierella sp. GBA30]|nr:hypothetical protein BGX28_004190 [Mortierella sp. GBA30]